MRKFNNEFDRDPNLIRSLLFLYEKGIFKITDDTISLIINKGGATCPENTKVKKVNS